MNINKNNIKIISLCMIASFLFILFFSPYTTVLNHYYGLDSAIFDVIGRGLLRGKLLYVDLFDHKGPMIFYMWSLGLAIGNGSKWGMFILQVAALTVTLYYLCKLCHLIKLDSKKTILLVAFYLILFCGMIYEGGLTEEWALPCDVICLYWAIKYLYGKLERSIVNYSFFLGIFFAYIGWMRINNTVIIVSVVFYIFCCLLCDRKYKDAMRCVVGFFGGVLVISLPIIFYFYSKDALYELFYGSFILNLSYASGGFFGKNSSQVIKLISYEGIIFVFAVIARFQRKKKENVRVWNMMLLTLALSAFACAMGYTFQHYFMIYLPALVVTCALLAENIVVNLKKYMLILCVIMLPYSFQIARNAGKCMLFNFTDYYGEMFDSIGELAKIIPDDEKDSVWGLGTTTSKYFAYNDITPCYKFFDSPGFISQSEMIYADTVDMLERAEPKWIFRFSNEGYHIENMERVLNEKYERVNNPELERQIAPRISSSQNTGIELYRRMDD